MTKERQEQVREINNILSIIDTKLAQRLEKLYRDEKIEAVERSIILVNSLAWKASILIVSIMLMINNLLNVYGLIWFIIAVLIVYSLTILELDIKLDKKVDIFLYKLTSIILSVFNRRLEK